MIIKLNYPFVFLVLTFMFYGSHALSLTYPLCSLGMIGECCDKNYIVANFTKLRKSLQDSVYGQHLVTENLVSAIKSHWSPNTKNQKALTISFHGWPGSGKNYVARFIQESLYYRGTKSRFVHHFIGRMHFPLVEHTKIYQDNLVDWIRGNVSRCKQQLFIFDEVDKMPAKVLDIIKPLIDYHDSVDGVDYRDTIFIFLSNTGSSLVNDLVLQHWRSGKKREDLRMDDFEKLIALGAFNEEGGFYYSDAIKSNLIDHYFPFLPMEYSHVRACILDEFRQRNVHDVKAEIIKEAMDFIDWGPPDEKIYSKTGCKRISQKVGMLVFKYDLDPKDSKDEL